MLVAPLAAVLPVIAHVCWLFASSGYFKLNYGAFGLIAFFAVAISYACTIFIGVPAYFLLRNFNRWSILNITACGFMVPPIVLLLTSPVSADGSLVSVSLVYSLFGAVVSFVFGVIAGNRKSDYRKPSVLQKESQQP